MKTSHRSLKSFHEIAPYMGALAYKKKPNENLTGTMRLLICPTTKRPKQKPAIDESWWGTATTTWRALQSEGSYGMNLWLDNESEYLLLDFPRDKYYGQFSIAPADVPVFGDSVWVGAWPEGGDKPPVDLQRLC